MDISTPNKKSAVVLLFSILLLQGLFLAPPAEAKKKAVAKPQFNEKEVNLSLKSFVRLFIKNVTKTADEIIDRSNDTRIKRNALRWKIYSNQAILQWAIDVDVYYSYINTWLLCRQMSDYFEGGPGKSTFGKWQPLAVSTSKKLEKRIKTIAQGISGDDEFEIEPLINRWAKKWPFEDYLFTRAQNPALIKWVANQKTKKGITKSVTGVEEGVNRISDQINLISEFMPMQGRWQAELFLNNILMNLPFDKSIEQFESIKTSLVELFKNQELNQTLRSIDALSRSLELIANRAERLDQLIDHVFLRLMQFTLLLFVLTGIGWVGFPKLKKWSNKKRA